MEKQAFNDAIDKVINDISNGEPDMEVIERPAQLGLIAKAYSNINDTNIDKRQVIDYILTHRDSAHEIRTYRQLKDHARLNNVTRQVLVDYNHQGIYLFILDEIMGSDEDISDYEPIQYEDIL